MFQDPNDAPDNVYQPAAANVEGEASGCKEVKIINLLCVVT